MIIPDRHEDTAVRTGPGHLDVTHCISGPVHSWPFAVPEPEDPVIAPLAAQLRLLCAPKCRNSQIFVKTRLETDVVFFKLIERSGHLHIDRAKR